MAAAPAAAQTGGTFLGVVLDDQGLALPGATITFANLETGFIRNDVTDTQGRFRAAALPPGVYSITAELAGFAKSVREKVPLTLGQELTVNMTMKVATLQETVTVSAAVPLVETTSNTIGTTVSREQLDALPVPGRTFTALAQTAPGVTGVGGGGVNAGGQLNRNNSYRIDGVSNDNNVLASPRGGLSMEAVREYVVIANQFSAEHGDASGALVSVVTRAGTNNLQGRAFLFHRDESLDAQDPFSKAQGSGQAPFSQQRGGAFLGGPIKRDRMHYFGTYEGVRLDQTAIITSPLVPTNQREVPNPSKGDQFFVRTDNRLSSNHTMFVRYRIDKQVEENSGVGGLNSFERGVDPINKNQDVVFSHTGVLSNRAINELRVQFGRHFADNVVRTPLDQPTINRPSGNFGKPSNQPQGRTEDRWQFVNNFSYTLQLARLEGGHRLQPHSRQELLQQQHRRHLHVRHRSPLRCQRSDDVSDAVHAEHRRPEAAAAQRRLRRVRPGQLACASELHVELRPALRPRNRVQGSHRCGRRVAEHRATLRVRVGSDATTRRP